MFRSRKPEPEPDVTLEQACLYVLQKFDERWAASRLTRPSHLGDGRPFEPDPLVSDLRNVFWRSCHTPDSEKVCDEYGGFILLMVTLQDLKSEPDNLIKWVSIVASLRMGLLERGATDDERTVSRFAVYLMEYWQSTGVLDRWNARTDGITDVDQLLALGGEGPRPAQDPQHVD